MYFLDAATPQPATRHGGLGLRIMAFLEQHIADSDLRPAMVAAAHHISVRQLYKVLGGTGVVFGEWVRMRRLERCRHDLALPAHRHLTVAAIGRRWGFPNATHFGRAFRRAFGVTPRDWRNLHLRLSLSSSHSTEDAH